jgi:hypothetical protein
MTASLERRRGPAFRADLLNRRRGYLPEWEPFDGDAGLAVVDAACGMLDALAARLDRVPAKHFAVLLDLLGVSQVPAGAARAPVALDPPPGVQEALVPAGTKLAASVPGQAEPVVFETEHPVSVTSSALVEVWAMVPGQDAAVAHGDDALAERPFRVFEGLKPVPHEIYLAHDDVLALNGRAIVEVDLRLRRGADAPLAVDWAWWDGTSWRPFAPFATADETGDNRSTDATQGLTRSGIVRLVAPCADSKPTAVDGVGGRWIRGRVTTRLAPRIDLVVPEVERVGLRSVSEWRMVSQDAHSTSALAPGLVLGVWSAGAPAAGRQVTVERVDAGTRSVVVTGADGRASAGVVAGGEYRVALGNAPVEADFGGPINIGDRTMELDLVEQDGLAPDAAVGGGRDLDVSKTFSPLGPAPQPGAAMYLAWDAVFAKPGAEVTLRLHRPMTAEEEADAAGDTFQARVNATRTEIQNLLAAMHSMVDTVLGANGVQALTTVAQQLETASPALDTWYAAARGAVQSSRTAINGVVSQATSLLSYWSYAVSNAAAGWLKGWLGSSSQTGQDVQAELIVRLGRALSALSIDNIPLDTAIQDVVNGKGNMITLVNARVALMTKIATYANDPSKSLLTGSRPAALNATGTSLLSQVATRLRQAIAALNGVAALLSGAIASFENFDPSVVAVALGADPPMLSPPRVAWEYWTGSSWAVLVAPSNDDAANLLADGTISFTVPLDWDVSDVNKKAHRWLRARLASGAFAKARMVSWTDPESNVVNFLPVVEPRPPVLDGCELFFRHATRTEAPQRAATCNDFAWRDETAGVAWPGPGFVPFRTTLDRAPALYLGVDGPVPAAPIGIFLDVAGGENGEPPEQVQPVWEGFDGTAWQPLAAVDGTRGLTGAGVVRLLWPGDGGPAPHAILRAQADRVYPAEPGAAMRFHPGERILLSDAKGSELAIVDTVSPGSIGLRQRLPRPFGGGAVGRAPLARFGTPRRWIRLRFDATGDLPDLGLTALRLNVADASHASSVSDEVLGSSDGTAGQVVFTTRRPLLAGQVIEVRELDGARAEVDMPILERELRAGGITDGLRTRVDPRTGKVREVWVTWSERTSLNQAGPTDRCYAVDRAAGRVLFGDDVHGRIPPVGADNIRISYRYGGGGAGNVGGGAISSVLSGALLQSVRNLRPAEGGVEGETLDQVLGRGPQFLRHQRQGVTARDLEALAREVMPGIARSRALGAVDGDGRIAPGRVRLVIVPAGSGAEPIPSLEVTRRIGDALRRRMPATASLVVEGPSYLRVGVEAVIRPLRMDDATAARTGVQAALARFFAPLTGGPADQGWRFGEGVHLSDVARALSQVAEVDAVTSLAMWRDGTTRGGLGSDTIAGDHLSVPVDHIVSAGQFRVLLDGGAA